MKSALLLFSLFCIAVALAARTDRVQVAQRGEFPSWELGQPASADELVSFTVFLTQKNLDVLSEVFKKVSNPRSADWGKFLTKEEMEALVRPDQIAFDTVKAWLGRKCHSIVETADSVVVVTSATHAAELFDAPFFHFRHTSGKDVVKVYGRATIPSKVAMFVDFVAGISELFSGSPITINGKNRGVQQDTIITPTVLKHFYQVPDLNVTNSENLQGIAAFQDYFSMGALDEFVQSQGLPTPDVTRIGPDCFPNCDQYESDLDIQYITSMAIGAKTVFINQAANYWILQFCEEVLASSPIPYVFSISYGWSELQQCDIAVANCDKLGYDSQEYVARTNTDFQKLGTVGTSVLVSDGDDGAPSLGAASGNCPMDPSIYCPVGGCDHATSKCNSFQVLNTTTNQYCFFPAGIGSNACGPVLNDPNFDNALEQFLSTNYRCSANIESDYENLPHFYSSCPCSRLQSVTSNGYVISQYTYNIANGAPFTADYPTSSPFVTSVGATQFLTNSDGGYTEVAASILTHAIITTGGGFSSYQAAEDYQTNAVQAWVSSGSQLPPSNTFDTSMRGYPDVAFNGHNYLVYYSNNTSDDCPCLSTEVDGTSASSPALAGLVTLINDQLLNAGKSPLGFLNYLLYQMAEDDSGAFFDITSGNNKCSRAYCCLYGYTAVPGWDPVSGLGSPNFEEWLRYITNAKGIKN